MRLGRTMRPCSGRVLVIVDGDCGQRRPGDVIRMFGHVGEFVGPSNPGERDRRAVYRQRQLHVRVELRFDRSGDVAWQPSLLGSARPLSDRLGRHARTRAIAANMGESHWVFGGRLGLGSTRVCRRIDPRSACS